MIEKEDIDVIVKKYDKHKLSIGTLGSHTALNIFKGAKEEGFRTVCILSKDREIVYKKFPVVDEMIYVDDFSELLDAKVQEKLRKLNTILVPHGSFNAYVSMEALLNDLQVPMLGNRRLLRWETNRDMQRSWLQKSRLTLPKIYSSPDDIDQLVIAKFPGARGGRGYFLADSPESFRRKSEDMVKKGQISKEDLRDAHLQQYVLGVNVYFQYFSSIIEDDVELLGMDKRYESTVDTIGRISANEQTHIDVNPTYTIIGNIPLVLRESLLPEVLEMGDNVQKAAEEIAPPGMIGPFCLETIITDTMKIFTFEISARIVAGSNVGIGTSPYAYLKYGEGMYMGRRIALEIRNAVEMNKLEKVVY